jgi:hypothetical protein
MVNGPETPLSIDIVSGSGGALLQSGKGPPFVSGLNVSVVAPLHCTSRGLLLSAPEGRRKIPV